MAAILPAMLQRRAGRHSAGCQYKGGTEREREREREKESEGERERERERERDRDRDRESSHHGKKTMRGWWFIYARGQGARG